MPPRYLVQGRPGSGKTTLARRVVELLQREGVRVGGFTSEEIREGRRRTGFAIEAVGGRRAVLADVRRPGEPRVGRYGVDLDAFERALPALTAPADVVVVDEIGKMELLSARFRDALWSVLDGDAAFVGTVHVFRHPLTDALKRRADVEVLSLTTANRDRLPEELVARVLSR